MENKSSNGGSGPIELSLELGCGSSGYNNALKSYGFTVLQMQELQLQALIFKYMEAGLPVPHHLVLPIWKSFAFATSHYAGLHHFFPSFFGYGGMYLEGRNGVDPEPGRCRRTDGKKWRCSKDAVQNHKYCERHMHRGKHRSKKLGEATSSYRGISSTVQMSVDQTTTNTNLSISLPVASFISNV